MVVLSATRVNGRGSWQREEKEGQAWVPCEKTKETIESQMTFDRPTTVKWE